MTRRSNATYVYNNEHPTVIFPSHWTTAQCHAWLAKAKLAIVEADSSTMTTVVKPIEKPDGV